MYDPNIISIPPGYGRIRFSKVEMKNILIAVSALTLAFTILFTLNPPVGGLSTVDSVLFALVASFVAVLTGFMLHEFAHKLVAQRSGAWAEFRAYPLGLVLAIMFSLMGFIFAAPGAVYIQGMVSRSQNGLISIAGPLTNMMLGLLFIGLALLLQGGVVAAALYLVGWINVLLAVFNLLPVPPLDGHKVLKWSVPVYIVAFGARRPWHC
jgi:Zn-dependent protease